MARDDGIYIARQGAVIYVDGRTQYITPGMTARAGHPILGQYGHLFGPLTVDFDVAPVAAKQEEPKPEDSKPEEAAEPKQEKAAVQQPAKPAGQPARAPKPGPKSGR